MVGLGWDWLYLAGGTAGGHMTELALMRLMWQLCGFFLLPSSFVSPCPLYSLHPTSTHTWTARLRLQQRHCMFIPVLRAVLDH